MTKLKLFIFICFCVLSTITQAQQAPYTLQPSDVDFSDGEITDYINTIEKNIIIPDNFDGVAVETIGEDAFYNNQLTEVIIPNSVKSIGSYAFQDNKLTEVSIGNSVKIIGNAAFAVNQLTEVSIPNSVESIGSYAFQENKLTQVIIPNSVKSIEEYAFSFNDLTQIIIPNSVESIEEYAFQDNDLTEVSIPNSVKSIGKGAFKDNQLIKVSIGNSVTSIGENAFSYNTGLTSFNLPTHYQGYSYSWTNSKKSGDEITDLALSYELDEGSKGDAVDFTITYNLDGGTNDANNPANYTIETDPIILADASKDGYTFEGWYSDSAFTTGNEVTEIATGSTEPKEFFAKFSDAITYDITYTLDGGTNDANNPADYTVETATITLAEASKDGYTFGGWYSEAAFTNQVTEIATGSTKDVVLYAKFDAITYDITYTLDGGTNDANNPADYTVESATITLANASKDGYTFEGWYSDAAFTADNEVTEITTGSTEPKEFFAKFSDAITYDIAYTLDGGTNAANNPADYTVETATITLADASKVGYTFEGWYSDATFTADNEVTEIATGSTGDVILYAKFNAITYDISYTLDGGTNDANNPADYTVETATITLADASKTGRTFKGWYSEAAFTNQVTEIATGSTGDISLYAKYSDEYTLQLSDVDFSDGEITAYTNTTEKNIIIPDNFNDVAVTFIGENAFQNNQLTQVSIPSSVTSIGEGAFSDNTGLTSFNLPAHYQGSSYPWSNGKKSGDEITDFGLSYLLDEGSKGDAVDFTISYTLDGGTNDANNPADYTVETATITLAEASKDGYTFEGWYSEAAFTNQVTEIATGSTEPKEFFAKFSDAITYDITYTLDEGTNAANNPADYTVETATITLADATKDGYTFEGWYSEAAFTNQVTEIATGSTGPKEFFAKFSDAITYDITYTLDEGTNAANNPADYTVETATITLADATKDGYTFEGWYSEAAFTNQVTEIATGSTGDVVLFAKYSEIALGIYTTNIKVFNFYPNPSIDFIQTELEVSSLTIRSISGSKVKQFEGGSFFDISNLKSGVYILLAIDKNGDTYKSKLLKE